MRRRQLLGLLGCVTVWPFGASSQQPPTMPVVGFLGSATADGYQKYVELIKGGLTSEGYVEGKNIAIEYRWADNRWDRLPELAADLVRRRVAVIITTGGNVSALAAMAVTQIIPIVFATGADPVDDGLVSSLSGSGANVTGITFFNNGLMPKRLEIVREALPNARKFGMLLNSHNVKLRSHQYEMRKAAEAAGVEIVFVYGAGAGSPGSAFAELNEKRVHAALIHPDSALYSRTTEIIQLAARYAIPTIYNARESAELGGLMSYGPDNQVLEQAGRYAARILRGEKPGNLPVQQPTKFELVINLKTAKALRLAIPPALSARADEVIE